MDPDAFSFLKRLVITAIIGVAAFAFVYELTENWYHRYNILRPLMDIVTIKMTSLPAMFCFGVMGVLIVVLVTYIRTRRIVSWWWTVLPVLGVLNIIYEFYELVWPPYPDMPFADMAFGTIGLGLTYVCIRFVLMRGLRLP